MLNPIDPWTISQGEAPGLWPEEREYHRSLGDLGLEKEQRRLTFVSWSSGNEPP